MPNCQTIIYKDAVTPLKKSTHKGPDVVTEPQGQSPSGTMMIMLSPAKCPGFSVRADKDPVPYP
jgi:hypothetical protein